MTSRKKTKTATSSTASNAPITSETTRVAAMRTRVLVRSIIHQHTRYTSKMYPLQNCQQWPKPCGLFRTGWPQASAPCPR
jgi:hypothetical protein